MESVHFTFLDYIFFISVFVITIATALYYAFNTQKRRSIEEYLFGGKNLKVIPVSFSLAATAISGSATIGQSMEVYAYGIHNWMILVNSVTWVIIMHFVFLPVFYELQLTSTFTYLEMRFDKSVKYLASSLYVLTGCFILPLTIYVPALAFQELTGINLYVISIAMGLLCIWYTAVGGIRAVIITDMFQFCIILVSAIVILIVGLRSVGGFGSVWDALERGKRLTIVKSDLDFEARGTIWAYLFSNVFVLLYYFGVSQSSVQRFISLPSIKEAKIALWCQSILCKTILLLQFIIGAIIYTSYEDCDPLTSGAVRKIDQIFPHYIQEKASLFSGFSGIFIAGIFAAGLSTASTLLNTISGTIYNDFLKNTFKKTDFDKVVKITVAGLGIVGIVMVFLIQQMGTIFAITFQCFTLSTVGVLGLFASGILFPNINSQVRT
ncbi:sodium-coupled monocarboxylate transporter 2-like [Lutzomyia longipalpis]|uniref:sodium-coupled monocarboxylate transporter 2-like n=1 Tax=Lutzomyia longipalpis TaxID=7200 RepID=UPI002483C474|nr:sodium-coupled monocarboxylate transporter 2-like [Lutzomyia longipalpis]